MEHRCIFALLSSAIITSQSHSAQVFAMKVSIIISFQFLSYATGLVPATVPLHSRLMTRAAQELTNPDNEPAFADPLSGAQTPKSRVLSGVGPQEANDRWFDWDESCANEEDREKVVAAFQGAMSLAEGASQHLESLRNSLEKPIKIGATIGNQRMISDTDPAYLQMFKAQDNRLPYIKGTFDLVTSTGRSSQGRQDASGPQALRFICDREGKIKNDVGGPFCT